MKMKLICDILLVSLSIVFVQSQQQKFVNRHQFGAGKELADFDCPEDFGYYPHETDCTQYYVCVFGGALQESCLGGLVYSRELQTCDWPRNAGCNTTSSAPSEKKKENGPSFSTIRVTDSRTERPSTKPLTLPTTQATRPRPFEQTDNQFGQDDFESGFTLRPDDRENRRGLGRKIDAAPNIQQIEERFETTTREELRSRQMRRFDSYENYEGPEVRTVNETLYEEYDDYYDWTDETSSPRSLTFKQDRSTEKQPLNRLLKSDSFTNRIPEVQPATRSKADQWQQGSLNRQTNRQVSGPVPLPVYSRSHPPAEPVDRIWPISQRIPTGSHANDRQRFQDQFSDEWTPGFPSNSQYWKNSFFAPSPKPAFSNFETVFRPEQTARKIPNFQKGIQTVNHVTGPLKTNRPVFDYTDYDYESQEFVDDSRSRDKQRFETPRPLNPQIDLSLRPNGPFATRPQPSTFAPPPQRDVFDPRPQEPEFQHRPQEAQFQPRPFEQPQFQPRPTEPPRTTTTTKPVTTQKTQKTTTPPESDEELEYDYEYVYDEFGNPVFEEESAEVVQQPTTRTTQRTTTTTERATTTTAPPRSEWTTTTATTTPPRLERITTTTTTEGPTEPPSTKKAKVKGGGRGSMKFSETSAASAGTRITPEEPSQKSSKSSGKSKKGRPTLKPVGDLVPSKIEPVDVNKFPPWRFSPVFETPEPDTPAEKCRPDVCQLPDCYCGGKDIPAGLAVEDTPQIVLLTFDDAVNDLNKELYTDIFKKGRMNPNGCPIQATFYISHEWTDYSQVQGLYYDGHEIASHTVSHSFGEQFSTKKWAKETAGQRDIMAAYAGVKAEDIRGMRAPFLSVGGNKMFKMLYDLNFTYDSSMPVYENRPPSYPYTLDYKVFHDCMIPPCPTKSYPGVWEVPMVMWQDLNGGRCSMGDGCSNPPDAEGVYKMLIKNFERHYTTNRAPFPLYYHAAWFTTPHHKEGFLTFMDTLDAMDDVWVITNWQLIQWMREPTPLSKIKDFEPFKCSYPDRPKPCNNPKVCNLWHKAGVRYMKTCQPCPEVYPWTGKTGVKMPS